MTIEGNRHRNDIRRDTFKQRKKYPLPSGFTWQDAPINIFTDGLNFFTDFEASTFKNISNNHYYVSPAGSDTNNGTSENTPFKSLLKAYQTASNNDTIILLDGIYRRSEGWGNQRIQKNVNIIGKNKGEVKIVYGDSHIYTKTTGATNVYQVNRSNVAKVIDVSLDEIGIEYQKAISIADCDLKEGSWYSDGTILYIHAIGHESPDNDTVFVLLRGEHFYSNSDFQEVLLYLEGISIYGGNTGNLTVDATNFPISIFSKNINFLYGSGYGGEADALNINGASYAFFQNCIAAYSDKDGFNYTAYNNAGVKKISPYFIEVNCKGFGNGLKNSIAGSENTNNGTTAHEGAVGIRINGEYFGNMGANVADVQMGTQSINLGCKSYDGLAKTGTQFDSNFCAQQSGAEMWLDGCIAFGNAWDVYAVSGTTMHLSNSEYDSKQGGGTYDIINVQ